MQIAICDDEKSIGLILEEKIKKLLPDAVIDKYLSITASGNNFFIFSSNINPIDFSSSQIAICILSLPYLHTIIFIISEKFFK